MAQEKSGDIPEWILHKLSINQGKELTSWCQKMFDDHFETPLPRYIDEKRLRKSFRSWVMYHALNEGMLAIDITTFLQDVVPFKSFQYRAGFASTIYTIPTWLQIQIGSYQK